MNRLILAAAMLLCMATRAAAQGAGDDESKYMKTLLPPGTEAPDFTFENAGEMTGRRLSSLRGRYVVLDFWASWCPDCRRDIPELKRLYERCASDSVAFVSVSFDKDMEAWQKCVADSGMTWMHHSELKPWKETRISRDYGIAWIPTIYLIGPDGRVITAAISARELRLR